MYMTTEKIIGIPAKMKILTLKENNYVYTGGLDYPDLIKPAIGDVILVRIREYKKGRAIGIV